MHTVSPKTLPVLALIGAWLAVGNSAWAAPGCIISTTPVAFGDYNPSGASAVASTGRISYTCTASMPISIALDTGINSTSFTTRKLRKAGGNALLNYNLYLDPGAAQIWGNGTGGSSIYINASPSPNTTVTVNIFGRMPAHQANVPSGVYTDTLTLTISW